MRQPRCTVVFCTRFARSCNSFLLAADSVNITLLAAKTSPAAYPKQQRFQDMVLQKTHLGPYQIVSQIGAGGMGQVYRARDTRLDRSVAIKILPSEFTLNQNLKQRFEREAKTISSLSHPHICTLHDVGHEDGIDYLVMEYCDGESLAARLAKGPLPIDQVLRYGTQIADAVDKAHRHGVIHRDIKPGNIILTKNGAKLLDFGLAKLIAINDEQPDREAVTAVGSKQEALTEEGTILGTFQYMAPEQLEGKPADARTDVFSLGAVLYEMATGEKAFAGKSRASLIAAILQHEPQPISRHQPATPPALDHVVQRCLEKDPEDRWQSARDVAAELQWIEGAGSQAGVAAPIASRRKKREAFAWVAAGALGLTAILVTTFWPRSSHSSEDVIRLTLPAVTRQYQVNSWTLSVSPDGKRVAFAATPQDKNQSMLWVRPLDSFEAKPLDGTQDAQDPFWSPDSRQIGFFAGDELKVVSADGGVIQSVTRIGNTSRMSGASWGSNGTIVFDLGQTGIQKVGLSDGILKTITKIDRSKNEHAHLFPYFLPDGERFLFLGNVIDPKGARQNHRLYVGSIRTEQTTLVAEVPSRAEYIEPGFLLFVREGNLMAQRFDLKRLSFSGEQFAVDGPVSYFRPTGGAGFSCSRNGVIAMAGPTEANRLVRVDETGRLLGQIGETGGFPHLRLSPKGHRAIVSVLDARSGTLDLWLYGLDRDTKGRFTFDSGWEAFPIWAPDETSIYFASDRQGWPDIYRKEIDGTGGESEVLLADGLQFSTDVSSDERFLVYEHVETQESSGNTDIYILPLEKNARPYPFVQTPFDEGSGRFSPNDKWVAFASNETGRFEVYLKPFPGPGEKIQISTDGGVAPRWSKDGKRLYFKNRKELLALEIEEAIQSKVPRPERLFESPTEFSQFEAINDREFLMSIVDEVERRRPVSVIVNWRGPSR